MPSSGVQTCALRSEEHTSELQSHDNLVCRLLLEKHNDARRAPPRGECAVPVRRAHGDTPPGGWLGRARCRADLEELADIVMVPWMSFFLNDRPPTHIHPLPPPPPFRF